MKKLFYLLPFLFLSLNLFAQSNFKPGYFIDEDDNRIECLIKNTDNKQNPRQFEYKVLGDPTVKIATISSVKEFEITGTVHRYKRFNVKIDRSSDQLNSLSGFREPDFREEVLFLRAMVEGSASVYSYNERGGLERFFFKLAEADIHQLVYKRYYYEDDKITENNDFKNQLLFALDCKGLVSAKVDKLKYQAGALVDLFVEYNNCIGSELINYTVRRESGQISLTVKGGLNSSALETTQTVQVGEDELVYSNSFDRAISPTVSFEVEYILPYRNRTWSIFAEPTFQTFNQEKSDFHFSYLYMFDGRRMRADRVVPLTADYTHISLPLGARYSFYLNDKTRIFMNGAAVFNTLLNKERVYSADGFEEKDEFKRTQHFPVPNLVVGAGFRYKNRVSLETSYHIAKKAAFSKSWDIHFKNSFSIMLGYTIL